MKLFERIDYDIVNTPFAVSDSVTYPQTLHARFFDAQDKLLAEEQYGYLPLEQFYKLIDKGVALNLPKMAFVDFSLNGYRHQRGLSEKHPVELFGLNAPNSLWLNAGSVSFMGAYFGKETCLSHSVFSCSELSFEQCTFSDSLSLDYAVVACRNFSMNYSKHHGRYTNFKNSKWTEADKQFEHMQFTEGKLVFANAQLGNGDLSFASTNFGDCLVNFQVAQFGNGRVGFQKAHFGRGEINFEGAHFGDGEFSFRGAVIDGGSLKMARTRFGAGDKSFVNTQFGDGSISFVNANLGTGKVSFKLAEMGAGKKDFHFTSLHGDLIFERCTTGKGNFDFRAVDFSKGKLSFTRTELGKTEMNFDGAELHDYRIVFKYTQFENGSLHLSNLKATDSTVGFENLRLRAGEIYFNHSRIEKISFAGCQIDSYIDLRVAWCKQLDLSETVIRDIIDLSPDTYEVSFEHINLCGSRLPGSLYIDWERNHVKQLVYSQPKSSYMQKAEQFRSLKENYNRLGLYESEDLAYVEFKRCEAKAIRAASARKSTKARWWAKMVYYFKWILFDKVGLYATSPIRVLMSMIGVYLLFTGVYELLSQTGRMGIISSLGEPEHLSIWERSFYHSAITFLTIGYGDYYPSGFLRWVSSIEGFMGLFLMSYFTVAFVRKILR